MESKEFEDINELVSFFYAMFGSWIGFNRDAVMCVFALQIWSVRGH